MPLQGEQQVEPVYAQHAHYCSGINHHGNHVLHLCCIMPNTNPISPGMAGIKLKQLLTHLLNQTVINGICAPERCHGILHALVGLQTRG